MTGLIIGSYIVIFLTWDKSVYSQCFCDFYQLSRTLSKSFVFEGILSVNPQNSPLKQWGPNILNSQNYIHTHTHARIHKPHYPGKHPCFLKLRTVSCLATRVFLASAVKSHLCCCHVCSWGDEAELSSETRKICACFCSGTKTPPGNIKSGLSAAPKLTIMPACLQSDSGLSESHAPEVRDEAQQRCCTAINMLSLDSQKPHICHAQSSKCCSWFPLMLMLHSCE